ncbi:alkaline phosphatase [Aliidiomarina sp. Khilg15.8]
MLKNFLISLALLSTLGGAAIAQAETDAAPRNLILVIGDGMGFPYLSAYRYYKDGRGMTDQADMEQTLFDQYLVGVATTYPADETLVTDSASSATALASGYKTYNGAIGVDNDQVPLKNMMEYARENGYLTAGIATTRVTHATPASFFTHVPQRSMEAEIADQFASRNDAGEWKFDLLLGSGKRFFVREGDEENEAVDHFAYFRNNGMRTVDTFEGLQTQQRLPLIGLFHDNSFPYVIDDEKRLRTMTEEGLRLLENADQPYVLVIEAAMIDWCGHGNDIGCAMNEMADLDDMLEFLIPHVQERGDTSLVITADHSTGGLTLGADGAYQFRAQQVVKQGRSIRTMANELNDMPRVDWDGYIERHLPYPLSTDQQQAIERAAGSDEETRQDDIQTALHEIVGYHTRAGWTTGGHTGEDVPVIAVGPWAEHFRGTQDHTDIAKRYIKWIQKDGE